MNFMLGITFNDWIKLLAENNFAVKPKYWNNVLKLTVISLLNSRFRKKELELYKDEIIKSEIKDPIFILGHWRSGTTLLHKLFSLDDQFAYPNLFQVSKPHSFLSREKVFIEAVKNEKAEKRPMDNMLVTHNDPGEDESAISMMSQKSPLVSWGFTKAYNKYSGFHTFCESKKTDYEKWEESFLFFLKKLTFRYNKPLVLKSPIHTGRIKILLNLFPNAKFIHVHRNPYIVFQSTMRLYKKMFPTTALQDFKENELEDQVIKNYKMMYDAYFNEKTLIPKENFYDLGFEEFEGNISNEFSKIYTELNISNYKNVESNVLEYLKSISNYKKNNHPDLDESLKSRIFNEWNKSFSEWGYAK